MEGSYSVATNNRFAFFMDEEDDPGDLILGAESTLSGKSPKRTEGSIGVRKSENIIGAKEQVTTHEQGKTGPQDGLKRRDNQSRGYPQKDRPNENKPTRDHRDAKKSPVSSNRSGNENRFTRSNRGRGRPPVNSRDRQENSDRVGENVGSSFGSMDSSQKDLRSRPQRSDRTSREGGREREENGDRLSSGNAFRSRPFRGGFRGGKREYERRSGNDKSSVKPLDKKEGAGSHNWGTVKDMSNTDEWPVDDTEPIEMDTTTEPKTDSADTDDVNVEPTPVELDDEEVLKEKEEETLTLDEYKALQEKKRKVPSFKERKPGENEDSTRWKDTFVYERSKSELIPVTREVVEKYKSSGRVKTALKSNFFFKDTPKFSRGGGQNKRGGFDRRHFDDQQNAKQDERRQRRPDGDRERRPRRFTDDHRRGGGSGGRARDGNNFNVEYEKDFPSLGTVSA